VFGQLHEWASHGIPVDCRKDWSWEAILTAIQAGPSPTALTPEVKALARDLLPPDVFGQLHIWAATQMGLSWHPSRLQK
jgi:hypothetical protein